VSSRSITFKNAVLGPLSLFGLHRGSKSACNHEVIRRACPPWLWTWLTAPCWDRLGASFAIRPLAVSLPLIPLHTQLSNRPRGPSGRGAERRTVVEDGGLPRVDGDAQNGGRDLLKCCSVIFSIVLLTVKMCFFFF
jgi:hypothetical protein